jgi:hypothetical protein
MECQLGLLSVGARLGRCSSMGSYTALGKVALEEISMVR